jgi:predicted permease
MCSALRLLARQPWSTAAIVGILALGMGATTATFAVFNAVLFRPLPGVANPDGLVTVRLQPRDRSRSFSSFSHTHLVEMRGADTGLDGLTSEWRGNGWVANGSSEPELIDLAGVARRYFDVLGLRMRLGRPLGDDEVETPGHRVVVISEALWRRQFAAAPDAVGRTLLLNGEPFTIAGVVSGYRGWSLVFKTDLWLPMSEWPAVDRRTRLDRLWDDGHFALFGRLGPGSTPESVEPRLATIFADVDVAAGTSRRVPLGPVVSWRLSDLGQQSIENRLRAIYRVIAIGSFVLLLLACANAATLILVRSTRRQGELVLRRALGGSRWRVMQLQLLEAAMSAAAAWGLGLGIAWLLTGVFRGTRLLPYLPNVDAIGFDGRVLLFSGAVSALTVVAFGTFPAWLAASVDPRRLLTNDRAVARPTHRLRAALVAMQFALSLALVVSAAVLFRSFVALRHQDVGFDPAHVVEFGVNPAERGFTTARADVLYRDILDRLSVTPGVEQAAYSSPAPISTSSMGGSIRPAAAGARLARATVATISPGYFATLKIPLVDGRDFRGSEFLQPGAAPAVVILGQALARSVFGASPAVGQRIALGAADNAPTAEVIGVAGDVKWADLRAEPRLMVYRPSESDFVWGTILIRSPRPTDEALGLARQVMRDLAPTLPLYDAGTLDGDLDLQLVEERVLARLMGLVAILAGVIAVAGLYAVVAQLVAERTRELGIRIALGAPSPSIAGVVLRPVAALTLGGSILGVGLILASTKLLSARVYQVSPFDPSTIALAVVALVVAALLAAWRPVRRATRIDPASALKVE